MSQQTSQPQDSFWDQEGAARKEAQGSPGCRPARGGASPGSRSALSRGGQGLGEAAFQLGHGSGSGADRTLSMAVHHGEKLQGFFFPSSIPGASPSPKREREGLPSDQQLRSRLGRNWLGVDTGVCLQPWPHAPAAQRLTRTVSSVPLSPPGTRLQPHFAEAAEEDQRASAACLRSWGREPAELEWRPRRFWSARNMLCSWIASQIPQV